MEESEEELKSFLMRMNKESERAGLKLNINTYVMVLGPITSWKVEEEKVGGVTDFLFLGSKINAEGDCSHEVRCLLLGKKTMANLDSVLKSRGITLLTKVHTVKAMVFPLVTYSCESWTVKKAEHQRIDALELWFWRRFLKVPLTTRRSNQSVLREINPEYSLEGLITETPVFWSSDANT